MSHPLDETSGILHAPGLLGAEERAALLRVAEAAGFSTVDERSWDGPRGYRLRGQRRLARAAVEDRVLAEALWARVGPLLAEELGALGLNERLRFYAYEAEDRFDLHTDGAFVRPGQRSRLTLLLYLSGAFEGGELAFEEGPTLRPGEGDVVLFPHERWHRSLPLRAGRKIVLRTDVMFALSGCAAGADEITGTASGCWEGSA